MAQRNSEATLAGMDKFRTVLIINPNSSMELTTAITNHVEKSCPNMNFIARYFTGPGNSPPSIKDYRTSIISAALTYEDLQDYDSIQPYDGFLVCCYSDHPLTYMLREARSDAVVLNILEASIIQALTLGRTFGILTTGTQWVDPLTTAVKSFMGGHTDRFVAVEPTDLGVLQLRSGGVEVNSRMKDRSAALAKKGVDVIILGCAGMTGMEEIVKQGAESVGHQHVKVVDSTLAGIKTLNGMFSGIKNL